MSWRLRRSPDASCGAPQFLALPLMLTDDHALHVFVERFLATAKDDDVYGLTPPGGGEAVARAYVIAVEAVRLDKLSEHLLNEPGLGRRPNRCAAEYVDQRFLTAQLVAVDVDGLGCDVVTHAADSEPYRRWTRSRSAPWPFYAVPGHQRIHLRMPCGSECWSRARFSVLAAERPIAIGDDWQVVLRDGFLAAQRTCDLTLTYSDAFHVFDISGHLLPIGGAPI